MKFYVFFIFCICFFVLPGCDTASRSTVHHSRKPKFLDDIYMNSHNKNCATQDCIDKSVRYPEKKYTQKKHAAATNSTVVAPVKPKEVKLPEIVSTKDDKGIIEKYAGMMTVGIKDVTNVPLYRFIDDWYGTDYCMGGTDKNGIDCSGFVQKLFTQVFGLDLLRSSKEQFSNCEHLKKTEMATEGDLVFFKTRGHRISHVGVYLMNDYFVHSSTTQGVMISSLKEEYWHKHFAGIGRIPRS